MSKTSHAAPLWVENLRRLMTDGGFNPRSLSLRAGLNATAVRDMLEGRTRFPRYDTVTALSNALGTTPAALMGDKPATAIKTKHRTSVKNLHSVEKPEKDDDLELLTEIIARLHELSAEYRRPVSPRDFAAMATTIYRHMRHEDETMRDSAQTNVISYKSR